MTMALASTRHVQPLLPAPGITPGTRRHRPLFAYGTLEIPAVMRAVVGIEPPSVEATLHGYARFLVKGATFPGIIKTRL